MFSVDSIGEDGIYGSWIPYYFWLKRGREILVVESKDGNSARVCGEFDKGGVSFGNAI